MSEFSLLDIWTLNQSVNNPKGYLSSGPSTNINNEERINEFTNCHLAYVWTTA